MRILLMCEGQNEEVILNILLDANAFCFSRDDLIGRRPYPIRQLNNPTIKSELKHYGLPVKVYRIVKALRVRQVYRERAPQHQRRRRPRRRNGFRSAFHRKKECRLTILL